VDCRATTTGFSVNHEYGVFFGLSDNSEVGRLPREGSRAERYKEQDIRGTYAWANFRKTGSDSTRADRPAQFYPVYARNLALRIPELKWVASSKTWTYSLPNADEVAIWPIDDDGSERVWSLGHERATLDAISGDLEVRKTGDQYAILRKYRPNEDGALPNTWWGDAKYSASESGTKILQDMGLDPTNIYPKSVYAVIDCLRILGAQEQSVTLDFFAGSATTGQAVINLNREEDGLRKFLLAEQGEYFDTITLPRIAKVMTAPEWKDGAPKDTVQHADNGDPQHWSRRTLPLVRVLRLERYEDSLNALDFSSTGPDGTGSDLLAASADEHLIRYWLQDESQGQPVRLSTERLADPFAYRLTLHEPSGPREVAVDLLETARLLLGLVPRRWREATDPQGQRHQWLEASRCADVARGVANGVATSPAPVLLWLRPVDDERSEVQAKTEYEWLAAQIPQHFAGRQLADFATVLHNRAAFWPAGQRAESIDSLLAQRMLERAR
jgi:adenine-specific DNA-methyltransferase